MAPQQAVSAADDAVDDEAAADGGDDAAAAAVGAGDAAWRLGVAPCADLLQPVASRNDQSHQKYS